MRRISYEIDQMVREETNKTYQFYVSINGVSYSSPKKVDVLTASNFRSGKPPTYSARDEKEWRSFINWWKIVFKKNPNAWHESERIVCAAVEFREKP